MQEILVNISILSLFVFLFFAMSQGRRDLRLHLWTAGWLWIVAHFVVELWQPSGASAQIVQSCLSIDALALAGTCFIYSAALQRSPGGIVRKMAGVLILFTILSLNLAISGHSPAWLLALVVVARQSLAVALVFTARQHRPQFVRASIAVCIPLGAWMLNGILHNQPEIVIYALLCEIYWIAAIDFFANGWCNSTALKTMIGGFVAWGAVFPVAYWLSQLFPHFEVDREVWNVPKFFVAVGMILVVIEEDTRAARRLGDDYQLLFNHNPEPFWITEIATLKFLAVNQAALDLHGYTRDEFLSLQVTDIVHSDFHAVVLTDIESSETKPHCASRHVRKDGSRFPMDISAQDIFFQGKRCRFIMAIDTTEREVLQEQLDYQARHDRLTGLPNRTSLPDLLANAWRRAAASGEKIAVLSLDIDRFKRINEMYGHRVGDACIQRVSQILSTRMRSMDIIARTGGDEFAIVMTGLKSAISAEQAVRDLTEAFDEPLLLEGYKIQLPINIGVALGPEEGVDGMALWRGAESARTQVEAAGPGRAFWFSSELRKAAEEQVEIETYLLTRMNEGGLRLVYQPIFGANGALHSMEALLRLHHPEIGVISPAKLIPLAEAAGLIVPLGEWVIEQACRQLLIWRSQGVPLAPVAVNVSGLHVMRVDFAGRLMAMLERYSINPRLIHIEVTESVAMRNLENVTEQMAALSTRGIEFSIDDFGTGHSSLARLSQLGASTLKIDRSFMQPTCTENKHSIVQAIITMAHSLRHRVVAEGVETAEQLACLRALGCDLFQGYLLSRPVAPDQIPTLIGSVHPAFLVRPQSNETLHLVESAIA
jgi:diguanylate cyclase (GGDEF)-like protein/PAS domain S-box-containing protein